MQKQDHLPAVRQNAELTLGAHRAGGHRAPPSWLKKMPGAVPKLLWRDWRMVRLRSISYLTVQTTAAAGQSSELISHIGPSRPISRFRGKAVKRKTSSKVSAGLRKRRGCCIACCGCRIDLAVGDHSQGSFDVLRFFAGRPRHALPAEISVPSSPDACRQAKTLLNSSRFCTVTPPPGSIL
jgi:hypothetical protein